MANSMKGATPISSHSPIGHFVYDPDWLYMSYRVFKRYGANQELQGLFIPFFEKNQGGLNLMISSPGASIENHLVRVHEDDSAITTDKSSSNFRNTVASCTIQGIQTYEQWADDNSVGMPFLPYQLPMIMPGIVEFSWWLYASDYVTKDYLYGEGDISSFSKDNSFDVFDVRRSATPDTQTVIDHAGHSIWWPFMENSAPNMARRDLHYALSLKHSTGFSNSRRSIRCSSEEEVFYRFVIGESIRNVFVDGLYYGRLLADRLAAENNDKEAIRYCSKLANYCEFVLYSMENMGNYYDMFPVLGSFVR